MSADAIIINADDLGLWPSIDAGILDAWSRGAISDSTLFANSPTLPAVVSAARAAGLPVGIHLNLTSGRPLCDPAEIPALVTPDGAFMKRHLWQAPLPIDQVRRELRRQLDMLQGLDFAPSHLDSHHHIHALYPEVLQATIEIARERNLPVRAINAGMREDLRQHGLRVPDHFSMDFYAERATLDSLIHAVARCPGGVLEIMTHPGFVSTDMPGSYRSERAVEHAALTNPAWHEYLHTHSITLIGFEAL